MKYNIKISTSTVVLNESRFNILQNKYGILNF